jgi:putative nucleotidyltransferase with HDIG domain
MNPSEILSQLNELPPLPEKCARLEAMMNDPASTFADMSRVIETDVGLASQVLKLANSAHHYVSGGVQSLEKAVIYLGMTTVYQMVLCMQSHQILGSHGRAMPPFLAGHSVCVALIAKHLSERIGLTLPDRAFAAGLLHDFGRVALYVLFPDLVRRHAEALERGAAHSLALEKEIMGVDHQEVGAWLAKHWKYPRSLVWVVSDHHGVGQEVTHKAEEDFRLLSDIVAVADHWSWQIGWAGLEKGRPPPVDEKRIDRLNLPDWPIEELRALLLRISGQVKSYLVA